MTILTPPLEHLYCTQWYAVNLVGKGAYSHNPSGLHSGLDLRAPMGTPIFAGADGRTETGIDGAGGKYINLFIPCGEGRELCVHHNHCSETGVGRKVKRGEQIGLTGNTGLSSGPHLHYGTRFFDNFKDGKRQVVNYNNSYRGYINPAQFFAKSIWYEYGREFKLPVDSGYGEPQHMSEVEWLKHSAWHFLNYRRLFSDRQKKALMHGYWGVREILDPGMFHTWSRMTKPEYLKRIGKL